MLTDGEAAIGIQTHELWDRKKDGGFPGKISYHFAFAVCPILPVSCSTDSPAHTETKILKRRVRDVIAPERNLGHVDGHAAVNEESTVRTTQSEAADPAVAETSTVANIDVQPSLGAGIPSALRTDAIAKTDWERGASSRTFTPMDIDTSTPGTRVASQSTRGDVDVAAADRCVDGDCE